MISLTRFDGRRFLLNADLIETVEARPDTVVTLVTRKILVVKEPPDVVIDRVVEYRRLIGCPFGVVTPIERSTHQEPGWASQAEGRSASRTPGRDTI